MRCVMAINSSFLPSLRRLRFFNVDGVSNPKVQSVYLADMPVHKAAFAGGGTQARAAVFLLGG